MRKYQIYALLQFDSESSGNAAAGVEFNVYNAGGGLATIYAQNGASPISQASPLVTDSNGRYEFYAANGRYSILFTDETIASQNDLTDVSIYEYGSAGARDAATRAEALAGVTNKLPDTIGVKAAFNQYGVGAISNTNDSFDIPSRVPNGFYVITLSSLITTPSGVAKDGFICCESRVTEGASAQQLQKYIDRITRRSFYRVATGNVFSGWIEYYTTDNFFPVNTLTSTSTDTPLAASQGKVIKDIVDVRIPKKDVQLYNSSGNITINFSIARQFIVTRRGAGNGTITLTGTLTAGDTLIIENVQDNSGVATITGKNMFTGVGTGSATTHTLTGQGTVTFTCLDGINLLVRGVY